MPLWLLYSNSNTAVCGGGGEYGKSRSFVYFHFFEALIAFEVQFFQGYTCIFLYMYNFLYTLSKTLIACRAIQLRFCFNWK